MNNGIDNENGKTEGQNSEPRRVKKEKSCPVWVTVMVSLLVGIFVFQGTYIYMSIKNKVENDKFSALNEIDELFKSKYIYEVDYESVEKGLMYAYAAYSGDKYARYLDSEEFKAESDAGQGNSSGIGVHVVWNSDSVYVANVMKDGPAEKAGLLKGDEITKIDGHSLYGKNLEYAVGLVPGEKGTDVILTVRRGDETFELAVTRGSYTAENVLTETYDESGKRITRILITEFSKITVSQFKDAVNTAIENGTDAFVFDVRDNPGGDLDAIVEILDYLVPEGPIVTLTDVDGNVRETFESSESELDYPMAVLANGNTASAAELFTCTLKDYEKAVIVGTLTYGKGCGQTGYYTSDGGVVFLTTFLYNPPYSANYNNIGIEPDIEVENEAEYNVLRLSYEDDIQLQTAIAQLIK